MTPIYPEPGEDLKALSNLHIYDVDSWRMATLKQAAAMHLAASQRRVGRTWSLRLSSVYQRVLEPAFVAFLSAIHLAWVFQTVAALCSS